MSLASSDRQRLPFKDREYQIYSLRIESLRFYVKNPPTQLHQEALANGDNFDDFVTIVTLHDDQTVTVMDASSYGLSFNESWGGSLDRSRSSARIFENIEEEDEDLASDIMQPRFTVIARAVSNGSRLSGSSISRCTSSTFTITTSSNEEQAELTIPDLESRPLGQPPPPPPSPEPPKMRLFDASTDSDLILRRRSILQRYPYYSDIIAVKDERGKPEAIYAKPASPRALSPVPESGPGEAPVLARIEKPLVPKRLSLTQNGASPVSDTVPKQAAVASKTASTGIHKGVQVEFSSTFVRVSSIRAAPRRKEAPLSTKDKGSQTDPSVTGDLNSLANELAKRQKVGLDRWRFDQRWDIVREHVTTEIHSIQVTRETRKKTEVITVEETPCFVQKRPISVGDRKISQRRRQSQSGRRDGASCSCF